jgi:hypothetical protein
MQYSPAGRKALLSASLVGPIEMLDGVAALSGLLDIRPVRLGSMNLKNAFQPRKTRKNTKNQ